MTINTVKLEQIVETAKATLASSNKPEAIKRAWSNAIDKAAAELIENPYYTVEGDHLLILSSTSGKMYEANGRCQCIAFAHGKPCKHRAAAQLVKRYLEAITEAPAVSEMAQTDAEIRQLERELAVMVKPQPTEHRVDGWMV